MKRLLLLFVVMQLVFLSGAGAQTSAATDAKPVLPPGPLPPRMPAHSSWSVTISQSKPPQPVTGTDSAESPNNAKSNPSMQRIVVVKTWPVVHEIQTYTGDGNALDKWYKNGMEAIAFPGSKGYMIRHSLTDNISLFHDYASSDFGEMDWLSDRTWDGVKDYQGRKCFFFKGVMETRSGTNPVLVGATDPPATGTVRFDVQAYLDFKTLAPVEMDYNGQTRTYQVLPAPTVEQDLPAGVTSAIQGAAAKVAHSQLAPDRPY